MWLRRPWPRLPRGLLDELRYNAIRQTIDSCRTGCTRGHRQAIGRKSGARRRCSGKARDLNVSEATLTGETFPVTKETGVSPATAQITGRRNAVFAGTSVRSGTARMVVVQTGRRTEIAAIAATLARAVPETEFARGIRRFGYLMTEVMLAIVIVVFFANLLLHRPAINSLLFSLALAVGLTPELLPAIISVTLARGARTMSAGGVIVRRLEAIENLGSMDLLCTDKTGTLTEGVIHLDGCLDCDGASSTEVRLWAQLNASLQTGMANPLDQAIVASVLDHRMSRFEKVDEIPYDFIRKRLSVIVKENGAPGHLMICKGAVNNLVAICSSVQAGTGLVPLDAQQLKAIDDRVRAWCLKGFRVLGLAVRRFPEHPSYRHDDEVRDDLRRLPAFPRPAQSRNAGHPQGSRRSWHQGEGHNRRQSVRGISSGGDHRTRACQHLDRRRTWQADQGCAVRSGAEN